MLMPDPVAPDLGPNFVSLGRQKYQCGRADSKGPRPSMEDAMAVVGDIAGVGSQYYGMFDGHGGNNVSHYCANNFHRVFSSLYAPNESLPEIIQQTLNQLHSEASLKWSNVGTTAAIAIIINNHLYTANVGDTRIVTTDGKNVRRLTYDHKSSDPTEVDLVKKRGGAVFLGRVGGILALSRAIGDGYLGSSISCEAYQTQSKLVPNTTIIIACDGVWDVMSDEEASKIAHDNSNPATGARLIMEEAIKRGTMDNVSVLVIKI